MDSDGCCITPKTRNILQNRKIVECTLLVDHKGLFVKIAMVDISVWADTL